MRRAVAVAVLAACALLGLPVTALAAPQPSSGSVRVLLVPDLRWSDVALMPHLQQLMGRGAVGVVSVRTQGEETRCADGLLEISAMTRVPSGRAGCAVPPADLTTVRERYRHNRYGAEVGLLGDLAGSRVAAGDSAADVVASTSSDGARHDPAAQVLVQVVTNLYDGGHTAASAAAVDARIGTATSGLPAGGMLMVVGSSDGATGGPRLHPIVIAGSGWPHRELASASTGRAPFVQLFDVGPTLLSALGVTELPVSVSGRAIHATSHRVPSLSSYVDLDRHARRALSVGHPTFTVLCVAALVCLLLVAWRRRPARWVARLLVAAPLATWLVQLVPWWRWPVVAYAAVTVGIAVVGAVAWRVVPAVTALVLLGDQLLGSRLQQAAPLGDNPLVAGRFHGLGNIAFGVAMAALLVCAAATRRWWAAALVLALGVVVDGAPMLGDDLGGVLALVPAAAVLVAVLAGVRIGRGRAAAALAGAVAVVALAAAVDYARPASSQTHAGRFVGQVLHGGAWRVVHRKLDAVLASFANPVVAVLVVAGVAAAIWLLRRRPDAVVASAVVLAVLGSALNDSGVFVGAAVVLLVAPVVVLRDMRDTQTL